MKKIIAIITMLIICSIAVSAIKDGGEGLDICKYLTEDLNISTNIEFESYVPYKNEVFNAYTQNGIAIGHITLVDRKVTSISCETVDEPTFVITVKDLQTIQDITGSKAPLDTFEDKKSAGDITIKGQTVTKKVKGFFTGIGMKIASWFS